MIPHITLFSIPEVSPIYPVININKEARTSNNQWKKDENQNAKVGNFVEYFESSDNLVVNTQQKLLVVEGLHDYIVVNAEDVLLICKKQNEQNIKQIVEELKGKNQLKSFI